MICRVLFIPAGLNAACTISVFSFDKVFDAEQIIKDGISNMFSSGGSGAESIEISDKKRITYYDVVKKTNYNILEEAKKLEKVYLSMLDK